MPLLPLLSLVLCLDAGAPEAPEGPVAALQRLSAPLEAWAQADWVKAWARGIRELAPAPAVRFYCESAGPRCAPEARRASLGRAVKLVLVDDAYRYGRIADPLGYGRAYELLAAHFPSLRGRRVLEFGYGNLGVLNLLARVGAEVTGVEVDPLLPVCAPELLGEVRSREGAVGHVRALDGHFPGDAKLLAAVGGGYDLVLSKNTLKKGYVHPDRPPPPGPRMHLELGVSDAVFLKRVHDALSPGGLFFIYNLSPAPGPPDQPLRPWSDGRSPFTRAAFEAAGFEVLAFDADDGPAARALGHVLEWDLGVDRLDLERDLFAHYTLARRPVSGP